MPVVRWEGTSEYGSGRYAGWSEQRARDEGDLEKEGEFGVLISGCVKRDSTSEERTTEET